MASITIDGSVYPAESGTVIQFDKGLTIESNPPKQMFKFGDGYISHLPLGSSKRKFNVAFKNRANADVIETYFKLLKGESFPISVKGETINVTVESFSRSYNNMDSLSATLVEYFA
jgi:hypothetical protein